MNMRKLGKTDIEVSEIGFGAWQLGDDTWGGMKDNKAIELVQIALDEGCNFFDTAPFYAKGRSEILLGKALKGKRDKVVIVTKFGHNHDGSSDFSADKIRSSIERSLHSLQTDYIDALLLHSPDKSILSGKNGHFEVFEKLKREGKIRAYGASVDTSEDIELLLKNSNSEVAEILFNVFHQETALAFENVKKKDLGLIVKVPLDSGWLTGKYNADSVFNTGFRERWSQEVKERRSSLVEDISFLIRDNQSLAQAALRFILSYSEISTVIPGSKNMDQLKGNLSASLQVLLKEDVKKLQDIWKNKISYNPLPW